MDGFEPDRRAVSRASFACRCALAVLLSALVAACSETTSSNVSLTTAAPTSGPTLAFDSIDGPPVGVFNRLVDNLTSEAQARQLSIASREGAANYRVRGYLAAQVVHGRTLISWVWDVYDDDKFRTLRITGEEAGGKATDPWSAADEAMLRRIARTSMDRLTAYLRNPAAPVEPDAATAVADAPEAAAPARKPRRPARAEAAPTAAEKLAMAAAR